jgi:uncharacterized protein
MTPAELALLVLGAALAGAINSVAGGGSLISWPAALAAGLPQVVASATNTVALAPASLMSAWAYRRELQEHRRTALLLCVPGALGSIVGALLLFAVPGWVFESVVPWLVLAAALSLVLQDERLGKPEVAPARPRRLVLVGGGILALAVYGGYFGAGIGIVILALLSLLGPKSIHELNAMKSLIAGSINGTAAVYFILFGKAHLGAAAVMAAGSMLGGYGGAMLARRVDAKKVRWLVVAIGVGLSAYLAWRRFS